jgi:hypothetical protein
MPQRPEPWSRHERDRWLRHDAHRFIRHDIKRFLAPGTDPADVYPALARRRDAEDAAFAAEIAKGYRLLAVLRAEVASIKADLLRRRLAEQIKYSPSQPRVPAGDPRGGQWTDRSGGQSGGFAASAGQSQDTDQSQDADLTQPMGNLDVGDLTGSSELGDLFQIKPADTRVEGVQVGGDVIRVCIASGISSWKDDLGIKRYSVTYDCAGGRSFIRNSIGNYRGILPDPFR